MLGLINIFRKPCLSSDVETHGTARQATDTRVVPKSHEQLFFLHANWEQQTKESAVVDGTYCCVILEYLVTPIASIT